MKFARLVFAFAFATTTYAGAPAAAITPEQAAAQDTAGRRRFDIPAQPLSEALAAFATEAGLTIRLEASIGPRAQAPALAGLFTPAEGLNKLLAGTGLEARFLVGRTVLIARPAADESPVYNLRPVEVLGVRNQGYSTVRTSSATKTETPLRDTPQSISVVTRDVIADQSMQSMGDVVRYIPGVTMGQGEGHRDAPTIRGNSSTADFFVDGVRDDAQYFRDLYNIGARGSAERLERDDLRPRRPRRRDQSRDQRAGMGTRAQAFTVEGGSFEQSPHDGRFGAAARAAAWPARFNGLYENSHSFRARVK